MKSSNPRHIQTLLKDSRINIKKKYGQNFLIDGNILEKIIQLSSLSANTFAIEIGPGLGSLTERLLPKVSTLLAYEIDQDLIAILNNAFDDQKFHLIHDDVLKRDIDNDIEKIDENAHDVVVIANLPYYITTPILMKCLEDSKRIKRMVVMMQLEVARRITAQKNTKDYNALSIAVQYRAQTAFGFKVPRNVFMPAPNVDSAVITLDFHQKYTHKVKNEPFFFQFIKACFRQRRKTLLNNLHTFLAVDKSRLTEALETLEISPQSRAESLDLETFIIMSNYFYEIHQEEIK